MVSPVDGLMVGNVLPETASVHLLLMSSFVALTLTVGSMAVEALAMKASSRICVRAKARKDGANPFGPAVRKREEVTALEPGKQEWRKASREPASLGNSSRRASFRPESI